MKNHGSSREMELIETLNTAEFCNGPSFYSRIEDMHADRHEHRLSPEIGRKLSSLITHLKLQTQ